MTMDQPIVGFHLDSANDWVAELACGHDQHVRHNPPWTNRPWVVTSEGRDSKLGETLECRKCDAGAPPDRARDANALAEALRQVGKGIALFHGARGTGKTMAAQAIARELHRDVLRIDLSNVVSKYVGETEKHLDAVFAEAERAGAVLLLDDADALFGKRSEVKDSHDRHANIEVSYLLQRIEAFPGVVILTTNARQNIDEALLCRLRHVLEFPPRCAGTDSSLQR
jgi:hypothetical protein